jgi:deoxyribodipyrimidine photo-lyase
MSTSNLLIYLVRRDLRVSDNPIIHRLSSSDHGFTHVLPLFVLPPHQIEVSGFLKDGATSPYPEAKSELGRYWRCGIHRTKFIAESIWNFKESLESLGSSLLIRVGKHDEVLSDVVDKLGRIQLKTGAVWMIGEEGDEETRDARAIARMCSKLGVDLQTWVDEKYFVDE